MIHSTISLIGLVVLSGLVGYLIANGGCKHHWSESKESDEDKEISYLSNDKFERKYSMANTVKEKIDLIKQRQKSVERENALSFIEEVKKLCDYENNKGNKIKLVFAFMQNIQKQKEPLGVAGIFFRNDKNREPEGKLTIKFNLHLSSRIKDHRIQRTQLTVFQSRLVESLLVILNNFEVLTETRRKDLLKKYLGKGAAAMGLTSTSSIGLFSDETTYNNEIRSGQVEFISEEQFEKIEEPCLDENKFVYGGGAFMKDELSKLLNLSPTDDIIILQNALL